MLDSTRSRGGLRAVTARETHGPSWSGSRRASGVPIHRLNNQQLREFVQLSQDLFAIASTDGAFRWVNPRWTELLGWRAESLHGSLLTNLIHPDDVDRMGEALSRMSAGEPAPLHRSRCRRCGGGYLWLEWSITPAEDGTLCCVARDVTPRILAEHDGKRRAELLELAEEVSRTGHWYIDLVAESFSWSPEIYRIHGLDPDTFIPDFASSIEAYHPEDRSRAAGLFLRAVEHGEPFDFELRLIRPNGAIRLVHSIGRPERDELGYVVGIFGVFRDITDDERVRRIQELEHFSYVVSHDLRAPIRTIRAFMELIEAEQDLRLDPQGQEHWSFVQDAAARLDRLVRDLARYARAGAPTACASVELDTVLEAVRDDLQELVEASGATITSSALPTVLGEPSRLRQVFQNLISNAIRFRGEEPPRIEISARREDRFVQIEVRDNGRGFEPRYSDRIFEPFQRLDGGQIEGTGIGLAIVKRIVQEAGGNVWASSVPGVGSVFTLRLAT